MIFYSFSREFKEFIFIRNLSMKNQILEKHIQTSIFKFKC